MPRPKSADQPLPTRVLIQRACNGNATAFGDLYTRFATKIYRFIYFKTSQPELAQDFTHEVFVKAWEKLSTVEPEKFQSWLFTIARNHVYDYYRTKKDHLSLNGDYQSSDQPSLAERLHTKLEVQKVLKLLDKLKPDYKEVVILRIMEGFSHAQIATITGSTEGNIRVKTHRALKQLRDLYEQQS